MRAVGREIRLGVQILGHLRPSVNKMVTLAVFSDAIAVISASMISGGAYHAIALGKAGNVDQFFSVGAILAASVIALAKLNGLYRPDNLSSARRQASRLIFIWIGVVLFVLGICFSLKISDALSRGWILSLVIVGPAFVLWPRSLLARTMVAAVKEGALRRDKIILITANSKTPFPADDTVIRCQVARTYLLPLDPDGIGSVLKGVITTARELDISEVHIATDWGRWSDIRQMLSELRALPLSVRLIADRAASEVLRCPQEALGGLITFEIQRPPLTLGERAAKRTFDIVVATVGLLMLAPLLLAVALAVWIDSPGPILFKQRRGGINGHSFEILKFRTMHVMEDGSMVTQATRHDERVTRVGQWMRRFSIDELPQLINVLHGHMSLVGPRPHALTHDTQYGGLIADYAYRHHVKPGITGWAQVNGCRGQTPSVNLMKHRVELDLWYLTNWSFWLDLRILFWTILEVFRARNAF